MNKKLFFCLVILLGSSMAPLHAAGAAAKQAATVVKKSATNVVYRT